MPTKVEPQVFIIAEPSLRWDEAFKYLQAVNGVDWFENRIDERMGGDRDGESLVEFMGKMCYRSWSPGLNPNVKKVRDDQGEYIQNILKSKHGSVLEHANFTFVFLGVSRVFTHELVRHRAGVAISQESMRFVRLDDIPFWLPEWVRDDPELMRQANDLMGQLENFQLWMAEHFGLDEPGVDFHDKKAKTSFMRRFAPDGVATSIGWTANVRTLRHVIEARTAEGAEEEIRLVFNLVAKRLVDEHPAFFGDFVRLSNGAWVPEWSKV